jgi:hypothetical protein
MMSNQMEGMNSKHAQGLVREPEGRVVTGRVVSAFDGFPATKILKSPQGGVAGAVVAPVVLTPLRARCADLLALAGIFPLIALSLSLVALMSEGAPYLWVLAVALPMMSGVLMQMGYRRLFRKRTVLMFTPENFVVRHGSGKAAVYDREEPHRFRLDNRHEKARREAERHEIMQARAQMKGRVVRGTKYHRETFHLVLDYGNQPHKLMEIMGQEQAMLVLGRVKAVDELMEKAAAMGDALTTGPRTEWDDMAGTIPEKV